jgi:hypothetical protein
MSKLLADIKTKFQTSYTPWVVSGVAVVAAVTVVYYVWGHGGKAAPPPPPSPPPLDPTPMPMHVSATYAPSPPSPQIQDPLAVAWEHDHVPEQFGAHNNPVWNLRALAAEFGAPDGLDRSKGGFAAWRGDTLRQRGFDVPWTSVTLRDEFVKTTRPKLRYDFLTVDMPLAQPPPPRMATLNAVSPSVMYDPHAQRLTVRANSLDAATVLAATAVRAALGEPGFETPDALNRKLDGGFTRAERRLLDADANRQIGYDDVMYLNAVVAGTLEQRAEDERLDQMQAKRAQAYAPSSNSESSVALTSGSNVTQQAVVAIPT